VAVATLSYYRDRVILSFGLEPRPRNRKVIAVDASLIQADASDRTRVEGAAGLPPGAAGRAVEEYLAVLDDAVTGTAGIFITNGVIDTCCRRRSSGPERRLSMTTVSRASCSNAHLQYWPASKTVRAPPRRWYPQCQLSTRSGRTRSSVLNAATGQRCSSGIWRNTY
jgi:hypothetical protein